MAIVIDSYFYGRLMHISCYATLHCAFITLLYQAFSRAFLKEMTLYNNKGYLIKCLKKLYESENPSLNTALNHWTFKFM